MIPVVTVVAITLRELKRSWRRSKCHMVSTFLTFNIVVEVLQNFGLGTDACDFPLGMFSLS